MITPAKIHEWMELADAVQVNGHLCDSTHIRTEGDRVAEFRYRSKFMDQHYVLTESSLKNARQEGHILYVDSKEIRFLQFQPLPMP